ncbi:MAG: hypothetical protein CMJ18_02560 [Phycisphaeraceae bacterium]|nr:hypothetical protein [Phycisphaeraceae bacterium]
MTSPIFAGTTDQGPVRIHPENPRLLEFRGRPVVLITATEHYGAVMNRPFRYERYLEDAAAKGMTLTRLFTLFRELQTPINPYSTCKPESTDYVAPYERTGPETARDGQPKFDLTRPNGEFYERLHGFVSTASRLGVIVEIVLFSNVYDTPVWDLNPLNPANNVNGLPDFPWAESMSLRPPDLFDWQSAHTRRIVEQTRQYDNVIYEICNEPAGAKASGPGQPSADEVDAWQRRIVEVIRDADHAEPAKRHLISGQQAAHAADRIETSTFPTDQSLVDLPIDIANVHPIPNVVYGGRKYDLGMFMSAELKLREVRQYVLDTCDVPRPMNFDEDNAASQYRDVMGWTIHRKRAWTTVFCGGHYDYIDFSVLPWLEAGTPESNRCLRTWFGHLSQFTHSVDLARARPREGWLKHDREAILASVLAVEASDYCIYLVDAREKDDAGAGDALETTLEFDLPAGVYEVATYSPVTGLYSPWMTMDGGNDRRLATPAFTHDLVVRIRSAVT